MKRSASLAIALVLAALIPAAAQAGIKTHKRTKIVGYTTVATWEYVDGDIATFVNVIVTDNNYSENGVRSDDAFVSLAINRAELSTGNVLMTGVAYVEGPSNFDFSIDKQLGTATLRVRDAIFQDDNSFTFFNVDMDLTWSATGDAYVSKVNDKYREPGFRYHSHFQGTFRDGIATGSIFGKNIQFTPAPSSSGQLQFNKFGNMEVTTETP